MLIAIDRTDDRLPKRRSKQAAPDEEAFPQAGQGQTPGKSGPRPSSRRPSRSRSRLHPGLRLAPCRPGGESGGSLPGGAGRRSGPRQQQPRHHPARPRRLGDEKMRRRHLKTFVQHGIAADWVELLGGLDAADSHLRAYDHLDIAPDPFFYNGTTTCKTLWMEGPVVTWAGSSHVARVGASLLTHCGLGELVAADEAGYIATAAALAGAPERLGELRRTMRDRLTDHTGFARDVEAQATAPCGRTGWPATRRPWDTHRAGERPRPAPSYIRGALRTPAGKWRQPGGSLAQRRYGAGGCGARRTRALQQRWCAPSAVGGPVPLRPAPVPVGAHTPAPQAPDGAFVSRCRNRRAALCQAAKAMMSAAGPATQSMLI